MKTKKIFFRFFFLSNFLLIATAANAQDSDGDGIVDEIDNCVGVFNPNQADMDGDFLGDLCDPDIDGDGLANVVDNCPYILNPNQANFDGDAFGDVCDPDIDNDGYLNENDFNDYDASLYPGAPCGDGNVCNGLEKYDADGVCLPGSALLCDDRDLCNGIETCDPVRGCLISPPAVCNDNDPYTQDMCQSSVGCVFIELDTDGDGVYDRNDNCINVANPNQADADGDGIGDLCDAVTNINEGKAIDIKVFPNPGNKELTVQFANQQNNTTVRLINASGQLVVHRTVASANQVSLNVAQLPNGIYFLEVGKTENIFRVKVIKE